MESVFLESDLVSLSPLTAEDYSEHYLSWLNDEEVNRYSYRRYFPITKESLEKFLREIRNHSDEVQFSIRRKKDLVHIGNICLKSIHWQARCAELGILIGDKSVWGRGFGTSAVGLIVKYGFLRLNLNRIEVGTFNPNAVKMFENNQFQHEGVSRQKIYIDGAYHDDIKMAILAEDFFKKIKL
ncbi:GNAT family N-acetyltransferase [Leptospira borgpetersenii]|uniref:Acetyltransferase (GNAT) domain protein n=2 Tax=Leptospira borgpetersenii TaxID=174 RepID=M3GUQ4_LEPBO|nr:GNAT family protein [Leptospira borgpetersenii]EKP15039.1 acetyltransferase (GNAT) domain protein [Leptospira borgpetersenii str. 200801926]EMF98553.1 acetyltransferase (GNAT) domain protein [Leptospira borgpetersenii str. 200701203]ENO64423.1 acetyltransferase (GNAT) domain protein [Leptospira borgpetersenii serovar Mini str. 201000851]